jgi:hypothetical protein
MTILNATVTGTAAVLVMDSLLSERSASNRPLGTAEKIRIFPGRRMALGSAGLWRASVMWFEKIEAMGDAGLDDVNDRAPEVLHRLTHAHPDLFAGFMAVHVGIDRDGTPAGYVYAVDLARPNGERAAENFEPVRLAPGAGHVVSPGSFVEGTAAHAAMRDLWEGAATGHRLIEFHQALVREQVAGMRAGLCRLADGTSLRRCMGGLVRMAVVDRKGVRVDEIAVLPSARAENVGESMRRRL